MKTTDVEPGAALSQKVARLYRDMEAAYDRTAAALAFSCTGCPDNCCDSYFLHHTYTEWLYLWEGLKTLEAEKLQAISKKAADYLVKSEALLARGERPVIMCPLNHNGLCQLYSHRLMICRLHGVPATFIRPDGHRVNFPGCFRCQEQVSAAHDVAPLDRTQFFKRLVELEIGLLGPRGMKAPKVKLTIARMIVKGPPRL